MPSVVGMLRIGNGPSEFNGTRECHDDDDDDDDEASLAALRVLIATAAAPQTMVD
jgi:hypothetical protein